MRYMIYDEDGNALGAFRSRIAAEGNLRAIAASDPEGGAHLSLLSYRDDGTFTGIVRTLEQIGPPVRVEPTVWVTHLAYASYGGRRAEAPTVNEYERLILGGRPDQLVQSRPRPIERVEPAGTAS